MTDSSFQFVMRGANPNYDNSAAYVEGTLSVFSGNTFESTPSPKPFLFWNAAYGGNLSRDNGTGYTLLLSHARLQNRECRCCEEARRCSLACRSIPT